MADVMAEMAGSQMATLKLEIAELRKRLTEVTDEEVKKMIRREIMNKETHYNILADRMRLQN